VVNSDTLADRRIEKYGLRRNVRVARQIRAELRLHKSIRAKKLIKRRKSFKRRRPRSETSRSAPGWQKDATLQRENRSRLQVRIQRSLYGQRGVPNASIPRVVLILEIDWNIDFNLIVFPEALLVNDMTRSPRRALRIEARRQHNFVFGIRFFRNQRPRQIQFPTRPARILAEAPQIGHQVINLLRRTRRTE
jgi:hypothetical protein